MIRSVLVCMIVTASMGGGGCASAPAPAAPAPAAVAPAATPATSARTIARGYGDVRFVAIAEANRIDVVDGEQTRVLAEGAALDAPKVLVVRGGALLVGGTSTLSSVDLATGAIETLASDVGPFVGIALDHEGLVVAAIEDRGLVRVLADGTIADLAPGPVGVLEFATDARALSVLVPGADAPETIDYLALVGADPATWAARDARAMRPFVEGEIMLAGAEYWPYVGTRAPEYPDDVLWGFYPEEGVVVDGDVSAGSATPQAIACAEQSYAALHAWTREAPPAFFEAVAAGASPRFYLWVNDYSQAAAPADGGPQDVRPGRFWYWERKPAVVGRVPGYWKWETTLTREGTCQIPEPSQIDAYLAEAT